DDAGELLREQLRLGGVPDDDILVDPGRRTVTKHRVMTGSYLHARFDEGDEHAPSARIRRELLDRLDHLLRESQAVLACDYGLGLVTDAVLDRLAQAQQGSGPLVVDA